MSLSLIFKKWLESRCLLYLATDRNLFFMTIKIKSSFERWQIGSFSSFEACSCKRSYVLFTPFERCFSPKLRDFNFLMPPLDKIKTRVPPSDRKLCCVLFSVSNNMKVQYVFLYIPQSENKIRIVYQPIKNKIID